ncbi:MAG: dynamin family protein, partial [Bacillota bacterium]
NSLLFEGKDLLPKAATPMTAALTIISYAEKPRAEIEFYNAEEWEAITERAKEYDSIIEEEIERNRSMNIEITPQEAENSANIPVEVKSAKELVDMAHENGIRVAEHFGETETIESETVDGLIGKLNNYVGADGKYTPLVKSSRLYINNEGIKNIEVVDTPGMNDPIVSRGRKTREFLGKCDVVFLLSYAGQFMDSSDIGVLTQNLPAKGIRNVVLVASKFDSVLLDEGSKYNGLKKAAANVYHKLKKQAENTILPLLKDYPEDEVLQCLKESLPPTFISAMAYDIAVNFNDLDENQDHILKRLRKTFPNYEFNQEGLLELANIAEIRDKKFAEIQSEKDEILAKRFDDLLAGQKKELTQLLKSIKQAAEVSLHKLKNSTLESLTNKQEQLEQKMELARTKVDKLFENTLRRLKDEFSILNSELKAQSGQYNDIDVKTGSREESYTVSTSKWYKPWTWGSTETRYRTVNYNYASAYDAVEQINSFVTQSELEIKRSIKEIIDFSGLKQQLIQSIIGVFDLSDENFSREEILVPIEKTIDRIQLPQVSLDSEKYEEMITSQFSGEIKGNDIKQLRKKQRKIIQQISQDIERTIAAKTEEIVNHLEEVGQEFINDVLAETRTELDDIKEQIADKEKYVEQYETLIEKLNTDLAKQQ